MKTLFILFIILSPIFLKAQSCYLGLTENEVRSIVDYTIDVKYSDSGNKQLLWRDNVGIWSITLNNNNITNMGVMIPMSQSDVNFIINFYNDNFVKSGNNIWLSYSNGNTVRVELEYDSEVNAYYFTYVLR